MQNLFCAAFFRGDFLNNVKQKYIGSAFLLLLSSIIVKAVSAVYKIPLTAYIGATGRGYFNIAYNFYMPIHAIIMGGLPVALSHLVSKYNEIGDNAKIHSLKKSSSLLFFIIGIAGTAFMIAFAKPYAQFVSSSPKSIYTILVLAPNVLFSSMAACRRSLAEGYMNMVPTAVSQVLEAAFKLVFGLLFAKYSMSWLYGMYLENGAIFSTVCESEEAALAVVYPLTSAAAMGGVTVGSLLSWIYVWIYTGVKYNSYTPLKKYKTGESLSELLSFSAPIIVSTVIQSLSTFFDNASVQYCLSLCGREELMNAYGECLKMSSTTAEDAVTYIYGLFSSAQDFKMLLPGFSIALGVAAVPAVSAAFESQSGERLTALANSIFKYTSIIGFGGGLYLSLVAENMLNILYRSSNYDIVIGCSDLVYYYGFTMIFYCLASVSVFSVQAIGCAKKSIPSFIVSAAVRVGLNFLLVADYRYNLYGAVISGAAGYLVILAANLYIFGKYSRTKYKISDLLFKPLFCSVGAFAVARLMQKNVFGENGYVLDFVILSGIYLLFFTIVCILSKLITFSEIKFLQSSKKMA